MRRVRRAAAAVAATVGVLVGLTGCSLSLEDLPAPAGTTGDTYDVTAEFGQVSNLAQGAKIKLGGVVVGEVNSISTRDYRAYIGMTLEKKFALGRDARFQIRFTTPLGDDFISVRTAGNPAKGRLVDGAKIPLANTGNAPNIEDTFSALSTLINGGGIAKLSTIATELNTTLDGRSGSARRLLINLHRVIVDVDKHKNDITRSLDGIAAMAKALNKGRAALEESLKVLPPTIDVISAQTGRLRALLAKVGRLGTTVQDLLQRSQANMFTVLDNLRPTLQSLQRRQTELIPTFNSLISLGKALRRAAPGDYLQVAITVNFILEGSAKRPRPGGSVGGGSGTSGRAAVEYLLTGNLK